MTTNPITDLIDDLCRCSDTETREAAVEVLDAVAPIMALAWPCDTCGGTGECQNHLVLDHELKACPDCTDGQVPLEARVRKLLAVWALRADIIRVAEHVRKHDDRPYDEADRILGTIGRDA